MLQAPQRGHIRRSRARFRPLPVQFPSASPFACRAKRQRDAVALGIIPAIFVVGTLSTPAGRRAGPGMTFAAYEINGYSDEMIGEDGAPRVAARPLARHLETLPNGELALRQKAAETALVQAGITFNVYS